MRFVEICIWRGWKCFINILFSNTLLRDRTCVKVNGAVGGIYSSVVPLYLVTLPGTAPRGLSPLQKNGGEGDAICFWILHHRLMRHREVMRGEWNWWPISGVEYWSVHLYLIHTLGDSMAVTIGYYCINQAPNIKKGAWGIIFPKLDDLSRVYKVTNVCPDTEPPFFFSFWTFANLYSGRVLRFSY